MDAPADAVLESVHAALPIQLARPPSHQVLVEGHGIPPPGARRHEQDADPPPERRHGPGPRGGAGHLHSHVLDGRARAVGQGGLAGSWIGRGGGWCSSIIDL